MRGILVLFALSAVLSAGPRYARICPSSARSSLAVGGTGYLVT